MNGSGTLLEQIADQARVTRQLQIAFFRNRDPARVKPLLRDALAAERELDRLLARRDCAPEQQALFEVDQA